jgi:hypothetical protein
MSCDCHPALSWLTRRAWLPVLQINGKQLPELHLRSICEAFAKHLQLELNDWKQGRF